MYSGIPNSIKMNKVNQKKLNNKTEKIAVTSSLQFCYKPVEVVRQSYADWKPPVNFLSKNGKFDTSKKYINIGGGNQQYKNNNDYVNYGKYLKNRHKGSLNSNDLKSTNNCISNSKHTNDERKPDNSAIVFNTKIKKPFLYKWEKKELLSLENKYGKNTIEFRTEKNKMYRKQIKDVDYYSLLNKIPEGVELDEEIDDSKDDNKFWNEVQGFDIVSQGKKLDKKIDRFLEIDTKGIECKYVEPQPNSTVENERNQLRTTIISDLNKVNNDLVDLIIYKQKVCERLNIMDIEKIQVQGLTFSTFNKASEIVNTVHEEIVINGTLSSIQNMSDNVTQVFQPLNNTINAFDRVRNIIYKIVKEIKDRLSFILQQIDRFITEYQEYLWLPLVIVLNIIWIKISKIDLGLSTLEIMGIVSICVTNVFESHSWFDYIKRTFDNLIGFLTITYFTNGIINLVTEKQEYCSNDGRFEKILIQGKDSIYVPMGVFLGAVLLGVNGKKPTENFWNSVKSFGAISCFSDKIELVIREAIKFVPDVIRVFLYEYFPTAYEYATLTWYDKDYIKDSEELNKLLSRPDNIYYSSHNVYEFTRLRDKYKNIYIPNYGHFNFFQNLELIDKMDKVNKECERRGLLCGKRISPLVVWIGGDSGVGKSTLAMKIAKELINQDVEWSKQVYTWNPLLDYQDNYNNQPIVIVNDYMQTLNNGEEQLLISMKDSCDWFLNPSSIDKPDMGMKGEVKFTSKIIIITSNITHLYLSHDIRSTEAFNRRRDIVIKVSFKDKDRIPFNHDDMNYSWAKFEQMNPLVDYGAQEISYDAIRPQILDKYNINLERSLERIAVKCGRNIIQGEDIFEDCEENGELRDLTMSIFKNYRNKFIKLIQDHYKSILAGTLICGVAFFKFFSWLKNFPIVQSFNSGDENTYKKKIHPKVLNRLKVQSKELIPDINIINKIKKNLFRFTTNIKTQDRNVIRSVVALYVGDDKILVPKHVFFRGIVKISEDDMILINRGDTLYETHYKESKVKYFAEDYALYDVSFIMPRYKNIYNLFDDGLTAIDKKKEAMAINLNLDGSEPIVYTFTAQFINGIKYYDGNDEFQHIYEGSNMIRFSSPLRYGDCGTPILCEINGNWKILGIHVGGLDSVQYAQLVDIKSMRNNIGYVEIEGMDYEWDRHGQVELLANVPSTLFPYQNNKTSIFRSRAFEALQKHITEPTVLSPNDKRNVDKLSMLYEGTKLYDKIVNPLTNADIEDCIQYLRLKHRKFYVEDYKILSIEESINGIENLDRIDMSTSPGYPYTMNGIKKKDFFYLENDKWYPTKYFKHEYNRFLESSRNCGLNILWTNCVKDERRPLNKILSSRIFTISNILFTIHGRRIFGTFVSNYVKNRFEHGGMVGINPYSAEWERLFDELNEFKSCNDGDYSKFDKDVLKEIYEICSIWFKEIIPDVELEGKSTWWWIDEILKCSCFSDILTIWDNKKKLVRKLHGNPSGWFMTVFLNDIANKCYMFLSWKYLINDNRILHNEYINNVKIFFYGDDNLFSVSEKYKNVFNAQTISIILKMKYNITYTSGDKSDIVSYNKNIMDCTFLKNHFVKNDYGIIVAGLKKETIQEMVSWVHNDDDLEDILNTALRFSYFWGSKYFEDNRNKLIKYGEFNLITYGELDYEFQRIGGINFDIYNKMEEKRFNNNLVKLEIVKNNNLIKVQSIEHNTQGLRNDEAVRTSLRNFGTNLVNQNVDVTQSYYNKTSMVSIPERANSLKNLLSRPLLILSTQVLADKTGNIATIELPSAWLDSSKALLDISDAYFFFKGNIKIQITVHSTPLNLGFGVAHVSYKSEQPWGVTPLNDFKQAWIRPHAEFSCSDNSNNVIMDVPWKFRNDYCELKGKGDLSLCDLNLSMVLPCADTIKILVYMWVENADVAVTRAVPYVQGLTIFGDNVTSTTINQTVAAIEENIIPTNIKGDQFDTDVENKLQLSALDHPNIPIEPDVTVMKREQYSCNATQISHKEKLNLYPKEQMLARFDTFGINEDEMSIDYLKRKWSPYIMTYVRGGAFWSTYTSDDALGTILAATSVGPYSGANYRNITPMQTPTFLDYISRCHQYWAGSRGKDGCLEYRFKFAPNRFHSGRVAVIYNPYSTYTEMVGAAVTPKGVFDMANAGGCYVAYFDINGQNDDIIVRLPFVSPTRWKGIFRGWNSTGTKTNYALQHCYCGTLLLVAITPLIFAEGSPSSINIACFVRGAPGYKIALPGTINSGVGLDAEVKFAPSEDVQPGKRSIEELLQVRADAHHELTDEEKRTLREHRNSLINKRPTIQGKDRRIKIDCWEVFRQIFRIPKIDLELPYEIRDIRVVDDIEAQPIVQSNDYVFLGDDKECEDDYNGIEHTRSLRDIMRIYSPYVSGTLNVVRYKINSLNLYRYGSGITLPGAPFSPLNSAYIGIPSGVIEAETTAASMPACMQWGLMYQGFMGSMEFRAKFSIQRPTFSKTAVEDSKIIRPNADFRLVIKLLETVYMNAPVDSFPNELKHQRSNAFAATLAFRKDSSGLAYKVSKLQHTYSAFPGLTLYDSSIDGTTVVDFEVPVHTIGKYVEVESSTGINVDCRPYIAFFVYTDANFGKDPDSSPVGEDEYIKNTMIKFDIMMRLGDSGRFGVLDAYPTITSASSELYRDQSHLIWATATKAIPPTSV